MKLRAAQRTHSLVLAAALAAFGQLPAAAAQPSPVAPARTPYAVLGVIGDGALADLLLVEGDPLQNLRLVEDPARNFVVIMKGGRVYKNLLAK